MQVDLFPDCSYGQIDADLVIHPSDDSFSDPIVLPRDADQPPNLPRAATVRGKLPFGNCTVVPAAGQEIRAWLQEAERATGIWQ